MAFFYLRTVCVVYALVLRIQHAFLWDFNKLQFPKKSVMEIPHEASWEWLNPDTPWCHHMPKQPEPNGAVIKYPVELLHGRSPKVFKTITIFQQTRLKVTIDRCCLFTFDVINGMFVASPQQAGLVCPCCNTNQEQWDPEQNIGKRSRNMGTENLGFVTIELESKIKGNKHQEQSECGSSECGWTKV